MTRKILITGAASGLGKALALQLASVDTHLILLDISDSGLQSTVEELSVPHTYSLYIVDLTNLEDLQSCLRRILVEHVYVDWIINCAGIGLTSAALEITPSQWQKILSVNLLASIEIIQTLSPIMLQRKQGKIINIASMFANLPAPSGIAYSTTKHALMGYTRTLAIELEGTGIDVHLVCPGFIRTALFENATYNSVSKETMLPDTSSMISPTDAANRILSAVHKGKGRILFPFYVPILWWLEWLFPKWMQRLWIKQWREFQQKIREDSSS